MFISHYSYIIEYGSQGNTWNPLQSPDSEQRSDEQEESPDVQSKQLGGVLNDVQKSQAKHAPLSS